MAASSSFWVCARNSSSASPRSSAGLVARPWNEPCSGWGVVRRGLGAGSTAGWAAAAGQQRGARGAGQKQSTACQPASQPASQSRCATVPHPALHVPSSSQQLWQGPPLLPPSRLGQASLKEWKPAPGPHLRILGQPRPRLAPAGVTVLDQLGQQRVVMRDSIGVRGLQDGAGERRHLDGWVGGGRSASVGAPFLGSSVRAALAVPAGSPRQLPHHRRAWWCRKGSASLRSTT